MQAQDITPAITTTSEAFKPLERNLAPVKAARDPGFKFDLKPKRLEAMDQWQWPLRSSGCGESAFNCCAATPLEHHRKAHQGSLA